MLFIKYWLLLFAPLTLDKKLYYALNYHQLLSNFPFLRKEQNNYRNFHLAQTETISHIRLVASHMINVVASIEYSRDQSYYTQVDNPAVVCEVNKLPPVSNLCQYFQTPVRSNPS